MSLLCEAEVCLPFQTWLALLRARGTKHCVTPTSAEDLVLAGGQDSLVQQEKGLVKHGSRGQLTAALNPTSCLQPDGPDQGVGRTGAL